MPLSRCMHIYPEAEPYDSSESARASHTTSAGPIRVADSPARTAGILGSYKMDVNFDADRNSEATARKALRADHESTCTHPESKENYESPTSEPLTSGNERNF